MKKHGTKQDILKLIYEFRYYCMLSYNNNDSISEISNLKNEIEEITKKILEKAHKLKVIEEFAKDKEVDYQLLKYLFMTRNINLEEIYIKLSKEKDKFFVHIFDGNSLEEKMELEDTININKKQLNIMLNKKVKAFY